MNMNHRIKPTHPIHNARNALNTREVSEFLKIMFQ